MMKTAMCRGMCRRRWALVRSLARDETVAVADRALLGALAAGEQMPLTFGFESLDAANAADAG